MSKSPPVRFFCVGLVFYACAVALQRVAGAYSAEFADDACSHYVSGLLVGDYLRHGLFGNPVSFLVNFAGHYPLVNIGVWPPLQYFFEGLWSLPFGTSRTAMVLFSGLVGAATGLAIYWGTARHLGQLAALFAGIVFILSPVVQEADTQTMVDVPVAFWCVLSLIAYERYLAGAGTKYAALFGVFAVGAVLTKGNGFCLALFPPLAIIIGRRFELLRTPGFWLPVPIVALLAGPWYGFTAARSLAGSVQAITQSQGVAGAPFALGLHYVAEAVPYNTGALIHAVGPLIFAVALVGFIRVLITGRQRSTLSVCAAALFASVFLFLLLVPIALQDRYLISAVPALLMLAADEGLALAVRAGRYFRGVGTAMTVALAVLFLSVLPQAARLPETTHDGMREAAREVWRLRIPANPAILVATNNRGECEALADLADFDPRRPSLYVVRGVRLLGGGGFDAAQYVPRFETPAQAMAAIDQYAIPFVLFRPTGPWQHLAQIQAAIKLYPDRWKLVYSDTTHEPAIMLYKVSGNDDKSSSPAALIGLSGPRALTQPVSP